MEASSADCPLSNIRSSTAYVMKLSQNVQINQNKILEEITSHPNQYTKASLPSWTSEEFHYSDGTDLTAQYVLVLDALNFCFWPLPNYEYVDLAGALKRVLQKDKNAFDAHRLSKVTPQELSIWLQPQKKNRDEKKKLESTNTKKRKLEEETSESTSLLPIPLIEERARLIREIGIALLRYFDGKAANLVKAAEKKASNLVRLVTSSFSGFRDHCIYEGKQIFLYKRAQIFVGDIYGAYEGKGLGEFSDLSYLTCFADYRVPQLLRHLGILTYDEKLAKKIDNREILPAGSQEEVEIRAATIQAVELLKDQCNLIQRKQQQSNSTIDSFEIDWLLWNRGESMLSSLKPCHQTLTIYY